MELRQYQRDAIDRLMQLVNGQHRKRVLVVSPTGSGKTVIAGHLIREAEREGKRCMFIAHSRELVQQCSDKLERFDVHHGIIMAGMPRARLARTQVCSKDTLWSRVIRREVMELPPAELLVLDEAHRSMSRTWQELVAAYPEAVVVGLTATPARPANGLGLGDLYEEMLQVSTYEQLIAQGHLVPTRVFAPSVPDLRGVRRNGLDYNTVDLEARMDQPQLVGNILRHWQKIAPDRQTIIFASGIRHSMHLEQVFREAGVSCEHIDGLCDPRERDHALWKFKRGEVQVITNCNVLTEGFDHPQCSCAVIARPTRSVVLYRQMSGRIQRPCAGKSDAIIIDHAGACHRHGFPDEDLPWTLAPTDRIHERVERERRERQDIVCPRCQAMYPPQKDACPECGAERPRRQPRAIVVRPGELREQRRIRANRETSHEEKEQFWMRMLMRAVNRNAKVGQAAHLYKDRFGVWPRGFRYLPRGEEWRWKAREFYDRKIVNETSAPR